MSSEVLSRIGNRKNKHSGHVDAIALDSKATVLFPQ